MASSLISGLIASGHPAQQIWAYDINSETLQNLSANFGINIASDNEALIDAADVVVLAVKPQVIQDVAKSVAAFIRNKQKLVVSIAAGITQNSLSRWLGDNVAIVRCMPNTPALVLTGATGLYANSNVTDLQRDLAESILRAVGVCFWVAEEAELDTITAVSGSGPAYYFLLMEAMEQAALGLGMSEHSARLLVQQTALGAAKIALESTESPEQLRKRVSSPGGTTERAIETFIEGGFSELVAKAIHAARDRSIEMSKQLGDQ